MKKALHRLRFRLSAMLYQKSYAWLSASAVFLNKGLHPKHRIMNYHAFFVDNIKKTDVVLDVGCGNGALAADLATKAKKVLGIDLEPSSVAWAQKQVKKKNLLFVVGDITKAKVEKCDVVVMSNVLEHIEKRKPLLKKMKLLAPTVLIRVPLITRSWLPLYLREQGLDYRLDPTHEIEYTEDEIYRELSSAGLNVLSSYVRFGEIYIVCK